MYRVMLIDDERALRSLLRLTVDWASLGLEVVAEAASGIEAINTIDEARPDIAFVDIRMPFMDGIEFSHLAMKQYPDLKIIILTAFDDFEYARRCVGLGICDYLMKPIVCSQINEVLKKITAELDARQPREISAEEGTDVVGGMKRVQQYILENFTDSEMNLTSIAYKFGFNASYLSRRFKADTGASIIDYLTKCRMERAIELSHERVMMYVAAKQVGIPDPNYFSKCFKKYTGKAYSEMQKAFNEG